MVSGHSEGLVPEDGLNNQFRYTVIQHLRGYAVTGSSPELNPIERIWKLVRRLSTHNRYFPELEDVMKAIEHTFSQWRRGNETLRKLCAIT